MGHEGLRHGVQVCCPCPLQSDTLTSKLLDRTRNMTLAIHPKYAIIDLIVPLAEWDACWEGREALLSHAAPRESTVLVRTLLMLSLPRSRKGAASLVFTLTGAIVVLCEGMAEGERQYA